MSGATATATAGVTLEAPRHVHVSGRLPMFRYARCADTCVVLPDGTASACGALACPSCGSGGSNLDARGVLAGGAMSRRAVSQRISCTCGNIWLHTRR